MLRTTSTRPAVAAALALVTTAALTGCGLLGGDEKDGGADKGSASATPAGGSAASSTPPPSGDEESSKSDQPRPAKADVVAGLKKFYDRTDKTNSWNHDKLANCIADKGYDSFSTKTLNAMKDGKPTGIDKTDSVKFGAYSAACATDAMPSGSKPPLPSVPTEIPTGLPSKLPTKLPTGLPN